MRLGSCGSMRRDVPLENRGRCHDGSATCRWRWCRPGGCGVRARGMPVNPPVPTHWRPGGGGRGALSTAGRRAARQQAAGGTAVVGMGSWRQGSGRSLAWAWVERGGAAADPPDPAPSVATPTLHPAARAAWSVALPNPWLRPHPQAPHFARRPQMAHHLKPAAAGLPCVPTTDAIPALAAPKPPVPT